MVRSFQAVAQTRILLSGSLKCFLFISLGEAEEQQCQLFEPEGRVGEKGFGQQPVLISQIHQEQKRGKIDVLSNTWVKEKMLILLCFSAERGI